MQITHTLYLTHRSEWREWLTENHATTKEIWLASYSKASGKQGLEYLQAVEEALCFGWIDGIKKKLDETCTAQRFTPRLPKGNWTELNKERARRLIASGQMTEAGRVKLPDLSLDTFSIAYDILEALQKDPQIWKNFQDFSQIYQRIRVGYIEEVREQPEVFKKRLNNFLNKTRQNNKFGVLLSDEA